MKQTTEHGEICQHCGQRYVLYRWRENGWDFQGMPYCLQCRLVFIGAVVEGGAMDVEVGVDRLTSAR